MVLGGNERFAVRRGSEGSVLEMGLEKKTWWEDAHGKRGVRTREVFG